jgi:hypothetical protein
MTVTPNPHREAQRLRQYASGIAEAPMTEMREKIARAILETKSDKEHFSPQERYMIKLSISESEATRAADAVLALIGPVMEENERYKGALESIETGECVVDWADQPHEQMQDEARATLSPKSEKQDG